MATWLCGHATEHVLRGVNAKALNFCVQSQDRLEHHPVALNPHRVMRAIRHVQACISQEAAVLAERFPLTCKDPKPRLVAKYPQTPLVRLNSCASRAGFFAHPTPRPSGAKFGRKATAHRRLPVRCLKVSVFLLEFQLRQGSSEATAPITLQSYRSGATYSSSATSAQALQ